MKNRKRKIVVRCIKAKPAIEQGGRMYRLTFNKEELMYLSLAVRSYQREAMLKAWDMERGSTEKLEDILQIVEKAAAVSEFLGGRIENRLIEALPDVEEI